MNNKTVKKEDRTKISTSFNDKHVPQQLSCSNNKNKKVVTEEYRTANGVYAVNDKKNNYKHFTVKLMVNGKPKILLVDRGVLAYRLKR